jgi:parvulin-like peptidyl-prolyl isomerase
MKPGLILLSLVVVWVCSGLSAEIDSTATIAKWDGGGITIGEYVGWWQRIPEKDRPGLPTAEAKAEFLNSMINAKLMLAAAESVGIDHHHDVIEWVRQKREGFMRSELLAQATAGRLEISDAEVEDVYQKRLTQIEAWHITVPTVTKADAMLDSIEAGVPFEDLAFRHSTCASAPSRGYLGQVRWGDFSDRWTEQAFRLEPGEISPAFMVESGYAIIKAGDRTVVELEDPANERAVIRRTLEKRRTFEEIPAFRDSMRLAYQADIDVRAVVELCASYAEKLLDLGITSHIIEADVIPDLTESQKAEVIASYRGGSFTTEEVVNIILSQPYIVRPRLDNPDEMVPFVSRHLVDTLDILEATKRGIHELPHIVVQVEKIKQRKTAQYFMRYLNRDLEIPDEVLRAFFESNASAFAIDAGHTASKILVTTKEASDSIMDLIRSGTAYEDIARERSMDPFSAPHGGDMGFLPLGKDEEFDGFFATMEVGDIEQFRSVEGFVILWLREKHDRRIPDFEEVRDEVRLALVPAYKEQTLSEWITGERSRLGVEVNEALLAGLDLGT